MPVILCPHCGKPVSVDETAVSAQLRREQELEIQRLQSELEQICARFELELQQKEREVLLYQEMAERLAPRVPSDCGAATADDRIDAAIAEIDQSIAALTRARETLQKHRDISERKLL